MRRPMDFWKGSVSFFLFRQHFQTINTTNQIIAQIVIFVAYLMYGAFVYVWILYLVSTFHFPLMIHILVLPRTIYFTTRITRSYQIFLAKFWCVCHYITSIGRCVIVWRVGAGNIIIIITASGIIAAGLFGNIGISGRFLYFLTFFLPLTEFPQKLFIMISSKIGSKAHTWWRPKDE